MKHVNVTTEILKLVESVKVDGYDAFGIALLDNGWILDTIDNIKYASVELWAAETIANETSYYSDSEDIGYNCKFKDGYDVY